MPTETQLLLALVLVASAANAALLAIAIVPAVARFATRVIRRRSDARSLRPADPAGRAGRRLPSATYDRLLRIVGLGYLFALLAVVAVQHPWPERETAILVLLAIAGFVVILLNDVLTGRSADLRYATEAFLAVLVTSAFVAFTGGAFSPFVVGYFLVVVAAALVVAPALTVILVALAAGGLLAAAGVGTAGGFTAPGAASLLTVDILALAIIAGVAGVVAHEQRRAHDAAIRLSQIDQLTGLFTRTLFFEAVDREIERSSRSGRHFCLLMADLDDLKAVNDTFGHDGGDRYIRGVADVIRRSVRRIDVPARYAGDEFVILLPETTADGAIVVAGKIRDGVAAMTLEVDGRLARSGISIGVVGHPEDGRTADELTKSADRAMYVAKRLGKGRVVRYAEGEQAPTGRRRIPVPADEHDGRLSPGAAARADSSAGFGPPPGANPASRPRVVVPIGSERTAVARRRLDA